MKKYIIGSLLIIFARLSYSQSGTVDSYNSVIEKIKSTYNTKDYNGFYDLLSPYFKSQQSQKDIESFLKDNVFAYYGNMSAVTFIKEQDGFKHYKTVCEKGNLEMLIAFNEKLQIEGFTFLPLNEEVVSEQKQFISDNKKQTALDLKVDSVVFKFMSNPVNSGLSIAVIQNGITNYYHYGEVKKETKQLPGNATIYEIGSVTKTFTGYLLAQAISEKKIDLNDDIRKYLPARCSKLEYHGTPIIIKHLVTHTSGIPRIPVNLDKQANYNELNPYKNYDKNMVYDYLSTLKIDTLPGSKLNYSNTGMALLGIILENVYKKPYEKLLQTYITTPLKMVNTELKVSDAQSKNFATGYNTNGIETPHWDLGDQAGAGGIKSSVEDMVFYLKENINETSSIIQMSHELQFKKAKDAIAFSWFIQPTKSGNTLMWHNGGTYGFTSFCGFIKEKKCGVVVLSNSGTGVDDMAISLLRYLQK